MPDSTDKSHGQDRQRINVNQDYELRDWARSLNTTPERVKEAVQAVGDRADKVRGRPDWAEVPAVQHDRIHAISEAYLGRPGPRLVEGYRQLRAAIVAAGSPAMP